MQIPEDDASHSWAADFFAAELVDLGDHESSAFRGVMTPLGEVGQRRHGVNRKFLANAEAYYLRHQGFDYWRSMLTAALGRIAIDSPQLVVEYGCGFGNATLPMLDIFPASKIIASDISPNLLAILKTLIAARDLKTRCIPVAMDAHKPYIKAGCADLVFGAAILHHLVEPGQFIASALRVLKPGGIAFFFEPLEGGLAILRNIFSEVLKEADERSSLNRLRLPFLLLKRMEKSLRPQILREEHPGWRDLDDKWAFPRPMLEDIASENDATVRIDALHGSDNQFRNHFLSLLHQHRLHRFIDPSSFPTWVWNIFERHDERISSMDRKSDVALEGCITFTKGF